MNEYINKEAQEKMGNHYIKDDVRNVSTDDGIDEDKWFEISLHTFESFDEFINFMKENFPQWNGYFSSNIDYHITDEWCDNNDKYSAFRKYFLLLKTYTKEEMCIIFEYWDYISYEESAEDIIKRFVRERDFKKYYLALKSYEDNENFQKLLEYVDWDKIELRYFKVYWCTPHFMFYKKEYSSLSNLTTDVDKIVENIQNNLKYSDYPIGMDYATFIAPLPDEERVLYTNAFAKAIVNVFKDDKPRADQELIDLQTYLEK